MSLSRYVSFMKWGESSQTFISVSLIELSAMGKDVAYLALGATESMEASMIRWGHKQFSFQLYWQQHLHDFSFVQ